jgi:hypothetical protein
MVCTSSGTSQVLDLLAELGLEGSGHVDLGEHAEPQPTSAARTRVTASLNGMSRLMLLP